MASNPAPTRTGSRETLWAILGSLLVAIILASVLAGNPFSALNRAYTIRLGRRALSRHTHRQRHACAGQRGQQQVGRPQRRQMKVSSCLL